jgi:hypothetical protein
MSTRTDARDLGVIAAKVVSSLVNHRQIPAFSRLADGLSIADAYQLTPLLRSAFEARGENITRPEDRIHEPPNVGGAWRSSADLGLLHRPDDL